MQSIEGIEPAVGCLVSYVLWIICIMDHKSNDGFKDGKKIEKIDGKGTDNNSPGKDVY